MNEKCWKNLHECEWKVKGDGWISLLWMKNILMTKFMNKLDVGTKHEILFWCFTIMNNITFVQWFMVVGWISYVIIILRNII
jgi:hypothetical protein